MQKGYFVYSGFEEVTEPVACFTLLEHAQKLSEYIGSIKPLTEIIGETAIPIDEYLPEMLRGDKPWEIELYGDGTVFEIDNGFEDGRVSLGKPAYYVDGPSEGGGSVCGTFWAANADDAVELAREFLASCQIDPTNVLPHQA